MHSHSHYFVINWSFQIQGGCCGTNCHHHFVARGFAQKLLSAWDDNDNIDDDDDYGDDDCADDDE